MGGLSPHSLYLLVQTLRSALKASKLLDEIYGS